MKRTVDNTLVSEVKGQKSSSDLNNEYEFDLLGQEKFDAAWEEDCVQMIDKGVRIEQYPISIEKLRGILDVLEKNECNYVAIDYNCDHPDYTFYGIDLHVATQAEIDEEDEKERQKELDEINKSLAKLEKEKERIIKLAEKFKTK
jgi:hypothetical protein